MNAELLLICGNCGSVVPPRKGCLWVGHGEIVTRRREGAEWDAQHAGQAMSLLEMLGMPGPVHWKIHHDHCTPEPEDPYWIGTEDVATWTQLAHWTAHLMEKTWFALTDWDVLLREVAGDIPSMRITPAQIGRAHV